MMSAKFKTFHDIYKFLRHISPGIKVKKGVLTLKMEITLY